MIKILYYINFLDFEIISKSVKVRIKIKLYVKNNKIISVDDAKNKRSNVKNLSN